MQHPLPKNPNIFPISAARRLLIFLPIGILAIILGGCSGESTREPGSGGKAFENTAIVLQCADKDFAAALASAAQSWATRTGATVAIRVAPLAQNDEFDVGILPVPEFGDWAENGSLARVPANFRSAESFQWTGLLPPYRERLIEWGGQAQAIPLAGEGLVLVYRQDRLADPKFVEAFRKENGRAPSVPATWEEFAVLAAAFTKFHGKPSLPAPSGAALAELFFRAAACFDHSAITNPSADRGAILSFQFDVSTARPRLTEPPFQAAAELMTQMAARGCFPPVTPTSDPAHALARGDATLAVLTLSQLANLPRENGVVPPRFGLAELPGTNRYFEPEKGMIPTTLVNYVPYFSSGWLGVVRTRCPHQDAAFDLLAELAGPTRSLETISTPGLGAGPFRVTHLERDRLSIWYGNGFDAERTKQLQDAMRAFVRPDVRTPAIGLRGPDQAALNAAAASELGKLAAKDAKPGEVLNRLTAAWNEIDSKTPVETRIRWRKMAAGAN